MPRVRDIASALALVLAMAEPAHAIASRAWLERLISRADVIVLADVQSIESTDDKRVANGNVLQTFKGRPGSSVRFAASPSWTCDSSWAEKGERALLFLVGSGPTYAIAGDGNGRLVVTSVEGELLVESHSLGLPIDVRIRTKPGAAGANGETSASLVDVLAYVHRGRIDPPRAPRLVRYWLNGTEPCTDAGVPPSLEGLRCFGPENPAWMPGVVRCDDAGIPQPHHRYQCGVWRDASKLICTFPAGDHSVGLCSPTFSMDGGMLAAQASADLFCDEQPGGALQCSNHLEPWR